MSERGGAWAINHLTSALVLMEQNHDLLGFARARMNLATVFLGHGNLRTELRYLRDLPADLECLEAKASLEAVHKNLGHLESCSAALGTRWEATQRRVSRLIILSS